MAQLNHAGLGYQGRHETRQPKEAASACSEFLADNTARKWAPAVNVMFLIVAWLAYLTTRAANPGVDPMARAIVWFAYAAPVAVALIAATAVYL